MRDAVAIVAPAVDIAQLERAVGQAHIALQDADRNVEAAERKTESLRQMQAKRRLELGCELVAARKSCRHGQWLPFLEKQGIEERSAQRYMELAGYVAKSDSRADVSDLPVPTTRDAGIDKRPRKSETQHDDTNGVTEWQRAIEARRLANAKETPHSDFVPVFKRVEKTILEESKVMYAPDRQLFAAWLRNVADEIDPLKGE